MHPCGNSNVESKKMLKMKGSKVVYQRDDVLDDNEREEQASTSGKRNDIGKLSEQK